jgi:four helix bundle protein
MKGNFDVKPNFRTLDLAEGSAKSSEADRHRFYRIALGSFRESETILKIIGADQGRLGNQTGLLAGHITNLCKSFQNPKPSP